jgi:hypothetical protein
MYEMKVAPYISMLIYVSILVYISIPICMISVY